MSEPGPVDLALGILDHQLLDADDRRCGKVDDLELDLGDGAPHVTAIVVGSGVWRNRGWVGGVAARVAGARTVGGSFSAGALARAFVHSLVPIAFAYVAAHYLTLLLFQGQSIAFLASDPLGDGSDLFGTADSQIDYTIIGANATWYWQVGFVVVGHVAALTLAHDRALALYDRAKLAVRSQYWMLAVMVGFTSLALWLLSQANA